MASDTQNREEQYRDDLVRRGGAWTTQSGRGYTDDEQNNLPQQVYIPEQLPDPENAKAANLPPQRIPANLVIDDVEEAVKHPQGPSVYEALRAVNRAEDNDGLVERVQKANEAHSRSSSRAYDQNQRRGEVAARVQKDSFQQAENFDYDATDEGDVEDFEVQQEGDGGDESYSDWNVDELREEAAERNIQGRSSMNKDELVKALEDSDNA